MISHVDAIITSKKASIFEKNCTFVSFFYKLFVKTLMLKSDMQFANNLIPDTNNPIVKFNLYFAFDYMPKRVDAFNKCNISIEDLTNLSGITEDLKIEFKDLQNIEGKLFQVMLPTTKAISETALVLVFISPKAHKALLFTCEFSFGCFMICSPEVDGSHSNYGQIKSLDEASDFCINLLPKDIFTCIETKPVKVSITEQKADNSYTIQSATRSEDIYGGKLIERLDEIYLVINYGAEELLKWLLKYTKESNIGVINNGESTTKILSACPILPDKGKEECKIIIASLLIKSIETEIVAKALINGSMSLRDVSISDLVGELNIYNQLYLSKVVLNFVKHQSSLLEYVKNNGKLSIATFNKPDVFGNMKRPIFTAANNERKICSFGELEDSQQTADFIVANKHQIIIQERETGEIVFELKENINIRKNQFFDFLLYKLYCKPLSFNYYIWGEDIVKCLNRMNISSNNLNPVIEFAFDEAKKTLKTLAISTGLIGTYN